MRWGSEGGVSGCAGTVRIPVRPFTVFDLFGDTGPLPTRAARPVMATLFAPVYASQGVLLDICQIEGSGSESRFTHDRAGSVTMVDLPGAVAVSHRLQAGLFGPFAVWVDDVPVELGGPQQRAVLAVLLLEPGRPVSLERLVDRVWGDKAPPSARNAVHAYVYRLRKQLKAAGSLLRRETNGYVIDVPRDAVDIVRFDTAVEAILDRTSPVDPEQVVDALAAALSEWRGPVLQGCSVNDLWLELLRAHLEKRRTAAIEALTDALLQLGRHEAAVRMLEDAVAADPGRESLVCRLMVGMYRAGRQAEALSAFMRCRSWLQDELGIEPSAELSELYLAILEQRSDLQWHPTHRRTTSRILPLRNPRFFGRSGVVINVAAQLDRFRIVALHGIGGAGKSVVALEVAHLHNGFAGWVNAENSAAILGSLAAIAADREINTSNSHQSGMLRDLWRDLSNEEAPLLVFDNASDPEALIPYLPRIDHAQVLVTSRSAGWGAVGIDLQVGPFTADEAAAYLLDRTGSTDRESAVELAEDLGRLPLACAQAAAFIEQSALSLREYRGLFTRRRSELLSRAAPDGYGQTVGTTWQLAFQELESGSPEAALLLQALSFLSHNRVPDRLVRTLFPEDDPELALAQAIRELRRFSLVDREGGATLAVHPLVQSVVRSRLTPPIWSERFDLTVRLLLGADPGDPGDPDHWQSWSALAPHVLVLADHAVQVDHPSREFVELIRRTATYLHHRGPFLAARDAMIAAVGLAERSGLDRRTVGEMHSQLGDLHDATGNVRAAHDEHARALAILEDELQPGDERVVLARARFAHLLNCLGQSDTAVELLTQALAVLRAQPGLRSHIRVCVDLGYAQWAAGAHAQAQEAFGEALTALAEQAPGTNRDLYAEAVGGLGVIRQDQGDLDEAAQLIERSVMSLRELHTGDDHPALAMALDKKGFILRLLGQVELSIHAHQEAERMLAATIGDSDPLTAMALTNLGLAYRDGGNPAAAADAQRRAHQLLLAAYGPEHPHTRMVVERLNDVAGAVR